MEFHSGESLLDANITIINDELMENKETFILSLTSSFKVKLFPHAQTEVIINDDDVKGTEILIFKILQYQIYIYILVVLFLSLGPRFPFIYTLSIYCDKWTAWTDTNITLSVSRICQLT